MNLVRNSLIAAIFIIAYVLFIRWNTFQEEQQDLAKARNNDAPVQQQTDPGIPQVVTPISQDNSSGVPSVPQANANVAPNAKPVITDNLITVKTDLLNVKINPLGGDIVGVTLNKHLEEKNSLDNPLTLLTQTNNHTYIARSGMVGVNGTDSQKQGRANYSIAQTQYSLEGKESINVDLTLEQENATVIKRFTFNQDSYLIDIKYIIENRANSPWTATLYGQIIRDGSTPSYGYVGMRPFLGAAVTKPDTNYKKISFGDIDDETTQFTHQGGWVALIQHYFLSAWVPPKDSDNKYELSKLNNGNYKLQFVASPTIVEPASTTQVHAGFYVGPKNIEKLENIAPHLELTVDYGWLWFIAKPLFAAMDFIHTYVGNWGLSIILVTCLIKILFLYPSAMSYRSMAKMRKLQPKMADLKEQYGEDRQRMSQELMRMYKKEKVNPLGGCLPILLQMPVFISLYYMIMESVELRHEPFIFWIQDLSTKDPIFILPVLMGVTMWIQQQLNPTPPDPMQAKIMKMLPIVFTALFAFFPAGLVLYWVVNNTLSIIQQYLITKQIEKSN